MAFKSCTFKISWIQLLQVYKTNAKYFVVGSNNAETRFKIIKISRTDPKELAIEEDHAEYTLPEIKDIIERLHAGNMGKSKSSWKNRGLVQTLTAFGIIGFVRFMEGYYMILVTKRSVAAEVGGHRLYKIEDTSMIYIPNNSVRVAHPEESRYLKSFQMVDLSSNFYYSYSYDLTNTLQLNVTFQYLCACAAAGPSGNNDHETEKSNGQRNMDDNGIDLSDHQSKSILCLNPTINERYLWNRFLKQPIENPEISANWTINVIHGFLGQRKINVYGAPIYVTLIARRSCAYAGTRFLKRGCNICGDSANEVETEQMVHSATLTSFLQGQYTAYVQHRASVPVFWFQDITSSVVPAKPPITLACADPYCQATGKHFSQLFERYGSPIVVLNLVKKHGRRSNESQLGKSFKEAIEYLNLFLPMKHRIIYRSLDMAHLLHSMKSDVIMRLDQIAKENLQYTGIFQSNAKLFQRSLKADSMWNSLGGRQFGPFRLQTGVVRSNCVDCLDRTNSAQFIAAKCAFVCQVFSLGILPYPEIDFDADAIRLFEDLFEEHGDIIALQYGGSQLVHTIESYRQTAVLATHSRDIVTTLSRYHSNTFSDTYKQSAINLFLGVYQPGGQHCPQWDMVTDNYLHNAEIDILESFSTGGYTMWLEHRLRSTLPLPTQLAVALQLARQLSSYVAQSSLLPSTNQEVDWYDEFYRYVNCGAW